MREIIYVLRFEINLKKIYEIYFFLDSSIHIGIFKQVLRYWTVKTLGDLQSTCRGLNPGVKM
jgi:hypothetical protein